MAACHSSDQDGGGGETIRFNSRTLGMGDQLVPILFFWEEEVYHEFNSNLSGGNLYQSPYLMVHPSRNIDFYRFDSTYYDTQTEYPLNSVLYATGFAPVISPRMDNGGKEDFHELFLFPENEVSNPESRKQIGKTDFLSCDGKEKHKGSREDPFGVSQAKELEFRHLTSKIVFIAQRDSEMGGKEYIKEVSVSDVSVMVEGKERRLHGPWHFKWSRRDENEYGYEPVATLEMDDERVFEDQYSDMLMLNREHRFDSCYVCNPYMDGKPDTWTGGIRLKMTVEATHSFYVNFEKKERRKWENQEVGIYQVDEETGQPTDILIENFEPGKEYRIYLNFYRLGVNLVAQEVDWDEGGLHYVPVTPLSSKP